MKLPGCNITTSIYYNIASRAAQSNSVYVSVLQIPIVHADSVSKSLCTLASGNSYTSDVLFKLRVCFSAR